MLKIGDYVFHGGSYHEVIFVNEARARISVLGTLNKIALNPSFIPIGIDVSPNIEPIPLSQEEIEKIAAAKITNTTKERTTVQTKTIAKMRTILTAIKFEMEAGAQVTHKTLYATIEGKDGLKSPQYVYFYMKEMVKRGLIEMGPRGTVTNLLPASQALIETTEATVTPVKKKKGRK
jgi:hypothetical protein